MSAAIAASKSNPPKTISTIPPPPHMGHMTYMSPVCSMSPIWAEAGKDRDKRYRLTALQCAISRVALFMFFLLRFKTSHWVIFPCGVRAFLPVMPHTATTQIAVHAEHGMSTILGSTRTLRTKRTGPSAAQIYGEFASRDIVPASVLSSCNIDNHRQPAGPFLLDVVVSSMVRDMAMNEPLPRAARKPDHIVALSRPNIHRIC